MARRASHAHRSDRARPVGAVEPSSPPSRQRPLRGRGSIGCTTRQGSAVASRADAAAVRTVRAIVIQLDLSGRSAVVTGGAKGIGLGVTRSLREAGAQVSVWGRDLGAARQIADELGAHAARCDVRDRAEVETALADTVAALGNVHILVTAAGRGAALRSFLEVGEDEWRDVLETNLSGVFRTCQVVGRHMADHAEGGKMVLLSSVRASMGAAVAADYAAAKGGLESMLRCMAMALAPHDIQVNAVRPGWIRTEMTKRMWSNPDQADAPTAAVPAGRWGTPEDVAGLVTYLVSSFASFHTGDVVTVDGGLTAAAGGRTPPADPKPATAPE